MNYSNAVLQKLSIHIVGNKINDNGPEISNNTLKLTDNISLVLKDYFINPFVKVFGFEKFTHPANLKHNTCYNIIKQIFTNHDGFHEQSIELANYLFDKSNSHFIKKGEFCVAYFKDIIFENKSIDCIGLFKSETKEKFIKVFHEKRNITLGLDEGIGTDKLDKGALIFDDSKNDGYKILTIDRTNKNHEAQYWLNEFLSVEPSADSYHTTQNYLTLTKQFITETLNQQFEITKADEADYLMRSVEYFKTQEKFNEQEFSKEVFTHNNVIDSFNKFKNNFIQERDLDISDEFDISPNAVKKQSRIFKSVIKLDRNFHIYIHGDRDLIEQGYDSKSGKKFYKIYFDEEQ